MQIVHPPPRVLFRDFVIAVKKGSHFVRRQCKQFPIERSLDLTRILIRLPMPTKPWSGNKGPKEAWI